MFNWFKKSVVDEKVSAELDVTPDNDQITHLAVSESEALKNQGDVCLDNGKLDEAAACFHHSIEFNPRNAEAYTGLGYVFQMRGNPSEAIAHYRKAVAFKPSLLTAHMNLGIALLNTGQSDAAEESFLQVVALDSEHAAALQGLGMIAEQRGAMAMQRGDFSVAEAMFRRSVELQPDNAEARNHLGILLAETQRQPEAEVSFRRALELKPDYVEALINLGLSFAEARRLPEAEACQRRVLELQPDYAEAHFNLGAVCLEAKRLPEAEASFRRALELKSDYAEAHGNLAIALLAQGDMPAGWEENEWRWAIPPMSMSRRDFVRPQWRGEAAKGRTLLIHAEQGFGDTLQFCRYASLAAARGLRVIMEVPIPLVRLLRSLPGVDRVIGAGEQLPVFDFHCPMLSMPLAFGTTLATIPSAASYLRADQSQVDAWHARLLALPNQGCRVGLVWAGSSRTHFPHLAAVDQRRSVAPELLAPLFELSGFHFFSLQKGGAAMPENLLLTDFMDEMEDFADTAALIANLDLVISVDTAVAHLAAALGKPVWVLDRNDSCWRWLQGREDSPWYPSLRLFRQPEPGDWQTVVERVVEELSHLAGNRSTTASAKTPV